MEISNRLNWIVAVIGVWFGLAPFILGFTDITTAFWNDILVGFAILVVAVSSALLSSQSTSRVLNWIIVVFGAWLIIAPFILGYSNSSIPLWNSIIVGILVAGLALWAALSIEQRRAV